MFREEFLGDDSFEKTLVLWDKTKMKMEHPRLSKVVKSICSCLPGSGGLELDIGRMPKVVSLQHGRLSSAFIEANLSVNLSMDKAECLTTNVPNLGRNYMEALPKRKEPLIDYFVNEVLEQD